jgi:NTE family protein
MNTPVSKLKVGLVLGSGASRGWSHIGIIKALVKEGIEPDIVTGTSVGAMIGACYLAGNLQKLEDWVLASSRSDVYRFFNVRLTQSGFVDSNRLRGFLHEYVADEELQIEDLNKPFTAVATNLRNGREVWFQKGGVAHAVSASMALPGLFPAVSDNDQWLVDGGLVNPVPVSACRALGAEVVIAVNLNTDIVNKRSTKKKVIEKPDNESEKETKKKKGVLHKVKQTTRDMTSSIFSESNKDEEAPGLFMSVTNSINIVQDRITRSRMAGDPAEVMISPKLSHIGMLEFQRAGEAIEEGERCVQERLDEIKRALEAS